jgi:hypothetical protein
MTESSQFSKDHVLRDRNNMPIGRAVVKDGFKFKKGIPIPVDLLMISEGKTSRPENLTYYVDGHPYRIPRNTPRVRFLTANGRHHVNSFILEPVNGK